MVAREWGLQRVLSSALPVYNMYFRYTGRISVLLRVLFLFSYTSSKANIYIYPRVQNLLECVGSHRVVFMQVEGLRADSEMIFQVYFRRPNRKLAIRRFVFWTVFLAKGGGKTLRGRV